MDGRRCAKVLTRFVFFCLALVVSDFLTEITMVCFLGFFVAVYWFGAKANRAVASSWYVDHALKK